MVMEGLRLEAYEDAAGVPTIGYGHTKDVRMGDRISEYWAKELLRDDIDEAERQVKELGVARNEAQLDALVSFVFNLGIGRLKESTLLKVRSDERMARLRGLSDEEKPIEQIREEFEAKYGSRFVEL